MKPVLRERLAPRVPPEPMALTVPPDRKVPRVPQELMALTEPPDRKVPRVPPEPMALTEPPDRKVLRAPRVIRVSPVLLAPLVLMALMVLMVSPVSRVPMVPMVQVQPCFASARTRPLEPVVSTWVWVSRRVITLLWVSSYPLPSLTVSLPTLW